MVVLVCVPSFAADDVIRIGILRFESKADGISQNNAESITDQLTRMLANSYSIVVVDRSAIDEIAQEQNMILEGLIDPRTAAQLGQAAGIQYLITGAITNYSESAQTKVQDTGNFMRSMGNLFDFDSGRASDVADAVGGTNEETTVNAEATIDLRIIDVNTHEVVMSMSETGRASSKNTATTSLIYSDGSNQNVSLIDSAVSDAVARIGARIKEAVAGEYPQVLRVSGSEVFLSLGATSGVKPGNRYKIGF